MSPNLDYLQLVKASKTLDVSKCTETLRVAILSDAASQQLVPLLQVLFAEKKLKVEVYEGPFDAIEMQVLDPASDLYKFEPDVVVVLNAMQALKTRYYHRPASGEDFLRSEGDRIVRIWETIKRHRQVPIIQSTFAMPVERFFGNFDHKVASSLASVVSALNHRIANEVRSHNQVFLNDIEAIASHVGRANWYDNRFWHSFKSFCTLDHLPLVAKNLVDITMAIRGRAIKCVVLDLDNTLWGGVIGDDGVNGIQLAAHGDGEAFYEFQQFLLELQRRGILLTVCSKNNPENAYKPFDEHPDMVLKRDHITVFTANWENKADNIKRTREALNIGMDSMVFLDDNPFERNLVRTLVPDIIVPELPEDPADYVDAICALNLFESSSFSEEDARRTEMYRQRAEAANIQSSFGSIEDYLKSLEMQIKVARFEEKKIPRIAQLFQRSNQFNLTTQRRLEPECQALITDPDSYPFYAELSDRLGDHGLISIIVTRHRENELFISDWLMSCRVLTRGVEQFLMNHTVAYAKRLGKPTVTAEYRPTPKNAMVKEFYAQFGFERASEENGKTTWKLDVAAYQPKEVFMRENPKDVA